MKFFLEQAHQNLEKGIEFENKRNIEQARYYYLKTSEFLFKAAQESEGKMKQTRLSNAQKLLEKARSLGKVLSVRTAGSKEQIKEDTLGEAEWLVRRKPPVKFDDIAGLDDVKEEINLKLIYPLTHPEKAKTYGIKAGGGILLYGSPGTGKTMIAQAVANEINAAFFTVKPSQIMSKWVGEAEQNIQKLFDSAHHFDLAVIFIDEVEALIPKRRHSGSTVMQRVVPQILSELEGFEKKKRTLLFIGATNEPWLLDPAALRPGRFDAKIYIPLPDVKARRKMLQLDLRDKPLVDELDLDELANALDGYSGADIKNICLRVSSLPFVEAIKTGKERKITMQDFLTVLHQIKPSVSAKEIQKYQQFSF